MKSKNKKLKVRISFLSKKFLTLFIFVGVLFSILSFPFFVPSANASINNEINFQGKLVNSNGTNVADNSYSVVFSLYNVSSGGSPIWTETDSVTTTAGIFQVELGANTTFPGNVDFNNSTLYLGIKVGTDAEMAPRIRFSAVPYAFNAAALDDVVATESATGFNLQGGTSSLTTLAFTTSGGALTFQPGVAEGLTVQSNGANGLTLDTGGNGAIDIGNNNATSVVFGNSSNNTNFTFNSGTGNITLTALNNANGLVYTLGTNGVLSQTAPTSGSQCLQSNNTNSALAWISCSISGTNYWQLVSGALSPFSSTADLLLGGNATTSARFAFTNDIGSGIPTASISANNGANATYLTGAGIFGTTNDQSLTIGSASTGNIQFYNANNVITSAGNLSLAGSTGINLSGTNADINFTGTGTNSITTASGQAFALMPGVGAGVGVNTTSPLASFDIRANSGTAAIASVSGATSNAGLLVNNTGSGDIITASSSGQTEFTISNNGTLELNNANYAACGALSTNVAGTVNCSPGVSSDNLGMVFTIGIPAGSNLSINFTGAANAAPSSASGTITFPANTEKMEIEVKGAGGGGGGTGATSAIKGAGGGGEGGYSDKLITTIANNYYVKVGGGGVGATGNATGSQGTATCLGSNSLDACNSPLVSATGGSGGGGVTSAVSGIGGAAGSGASGDINLTGGAGRSGGSVGTVEFGGGGGGIGGGADDHTLDSTGNPGSNGGGGGGALSSGINSNNGASGGNGYIVFYIYTNSSSGSSTSGWNQYADGVLAPLNLNTDVLIGGIASSSADFGFIGVDSSSPVASISAFTNGGDKNGLSLASSTSTIQSLMNNSLILGGNTTGAIAFQPGGISAGSSLYLATNGSAGIGTLSPLATLDVRGNSATTPAASVSASTNFAGLVVNNSGSGDLFTASKSGATKFVVENNGNIGFAGTNSVLSTLASAATSAVTWTLPNATGNICISTNNCGFAIGTNEWQQISGAISPTTITDDMLLGGISTTSARFAFTNDIGSGTPTASISANNGANATYLTGAGLLATTNAQSLTLGSASTGNIQFYNSNNSITSGGNLTLAGTTGINLSGIGAGINFTGTGTDSITTAPGQILALMPGVGAGIGVNTTSPLASFDIRGDSGTTATASVSGATSFAGLIVDNTGSGDLLTASKSGATKFTVLNNGNVQINNYTTNGGLLFTNGNGLVTQTAASSNTQCLLGGLTPTWGTCAIGTNEWQQISGAISPTTITDDMLLGGISTTSARFAFTNDIGSGTPTASISANNGANATYLTGAGLLATTNAQSLTLGSASTGNIQFYNSNNSITSGGNLTLAGTTGINLSGIGAGINFTGTGTDSITTAPGQILALMPGVGAGIGVNTTSPLASFDIRANSGTTATASVSGATSFAGLVVNNSGSGDLFTASKSGATKFVVDNNGNIGFAGTNTVLSTLASAATSAVTWTLPNATGNICISTNNCGFATGTNEWQQISGAISPTTITDDVLLGGNATTSARFAFTANDGVGIPTASISANSGANATYLTGTGILATTNAQSLTLGSATTGNVMLHPGGGVAELTAYANGTVGIGTTASTLATLDVRANSGTLAIASVSGSTSFAGLVVNNSGSGDIFTASKSGTTKFVINSQGNIGINTAIPLATLDVRDTSATTPIASFSGSTNFAGLVVNNSGTGDLITASNAGRTKFLVSNNGNVFLGGDTISASGSGSLGNGSPDVINALPDEGSLVPNAGFEANTSHSQLGDGWVPNASNSGTLILDTIQTDAAQGTDSIKWTTTATNQSAAIYSACFPITGIVADTYNLVWSQKGSAGNAVTVRGNIDEYASKAGCLGNTGLTSSADAPVTGIIASWADTIGTTAIAPTAGETWGRVHIFLASGASGVSAWIDGVRLVESSLQDGLDYAEDYPADPNNIPQPGQVVSIVASGSGTIVIPSDKYMDDSTIGVVSTNPGQVLNDGSMANPVPIALAGRVPVNVSTSNGTIQVGDYLTSSTIPGVAVKATGAGPVIGTAMEEDTDFNTSNVTQITMFIKNTYYNGGSETATVGLNLLSGVQDPSILLNILQGVQTAGNSALTSLTSGQTTAGLNYLYTAITTAASQSADIIGQVNATSSANSNIINNAITGLNVNGSATVSADLHVQGNSLFEGILHVVDTLFANDFIANGVSEFFGNVIFHSGVTFTNTPIFDSNTAGFAVIKKGSDHVDVTFNEIYDQTPIINASITLNPIIPTPSETLSDQETRENQIESSALNNIHYIIINRSTKGFTILLQQSADEDISFSWIALAVNSPMLFQSSGQNVQVPTPSEELSPSPIDTIIPTDIPVTPVESPKVINILTPTPGG